MLGRVNRRLATLALHALLWLAFGPTHHNCVWASRLPFALHTINVYGCPLAQGFIRSGPLYRIVDIQRGPHCIKLALRLDLGGDWIDFLMFVLMEGQGDGNLESCNLTTATTCMTYLAGIPKGMDNTGTGMLWRSCFQLRSRER